MAYRDSCIQVVHILNLFTSWQTLFFLGAVFQMDARNTSEYNAFRSYPSSASLLWQNFQIKEKIVHVKDAHDSFQMASASVSPLSFSFFFIKIYSSLLTA